MVPCREERVCHSEVSSMDVDCAKCIANCTTQKALDELIPLGEDTLEQNFYNTSLRLWHVLFMGFASVMAVVVCVCCCVRFRIPRTKQEIEADYVRKQITRKFQKQLRLIQNSEMDEMDLKRALERISAEFKSELGNGDSNSNHSNLSNDNEDSVFKAGDTHLGVSNDDLIGKPQKGFGSKVASFVGFLRPRKVQTNSPKKSTKLRV